MGNGERFKKRIRLIPVKLRERRRENEEKMVRK